MKSGAQVVTPQNYRLSRYRVMVSAREVIDGEKPIRLPWRCFEALLLLIERKGQIVDRESFYSRLWPGVSIDESNLNQCIAKLRKELGDPAEGGLIETVARRGYRLTVLPEPMLAPVTQLERDEPLSQTVRKPVPGRGWGPWAIVLVASAFLAVSIAMGWREWSRRQQAQRWANEGFRLIRLAPQWRQAEAHMLFRQAIELYPGYALAHAGLAEGVARSEENTPGQAAALAEGAVKMDPACIECKAIAGWIFMTREWRFLEAAQYLEEAAAGRPQDPRIRLWYGQMLAIAGRMEAAQIEAKRAVELDPTNAAAITMLSGVYYLSGRLQDAVTTAKRAIALQPTIGGGQDWLFRASVALNRPEEAIAARVHRSALYLNMSWEARNAMEEQLLKVYRKRGVRGLVENWLAATAGERTHQRYDRAVWRMWIGDREGALEEIEHLLEYRPFHCIYLGVDPMFEPIRSDARFQRVLSAIGFDKISGTRLAVERR